MNKLKDFELINYSDLEIKIIANKISKLEGRGYYTSGATCPKCNETATLIQCASFIRLFCLNCDEVTKEEGYDF